VFFAIGQRDVYNVTKNVYNVAKKQTVLSVIAFIVGFDQRFSDKTVIKR
jgi:hypothetical protein